MLVEKLLRLNFKGKTSSGALYFRCTCICCILNEISFFSMIFQLIAISILCYTFILSLTNQNKMCQDCPAPLPDSFTLNLKCLNLCLCIIFFIHIFKSLYNYVSICLCQFYLSYAFYINLLRLSKEKHHFIGQNK